MSHLINETELDIENRSEKAEALMIIKTILRSKIQPDRIEYGYAKSYFAVLLDDNNRRTICRLYLGSRKKSIGLIDSRKIETKKEIQSIDDIFGFADDLMATVTDYDDHY